MNYANFLPHLVFGQASRLCSGRCACARRRIIASIVGIIGIALSAVMPPATAANALEQCITLSSQVDDIHTCMDNYLDDLDKNLATLVGRVQQRSTAQGQAAFSQAQISFENYRRANCLWYLQFNQPREVAEQIAKNCLADSTQQRISELQSILERPDDKKSLVSGYYVYGVGSNSFQPCGSQNRYWVAGDDELVNGLQQAYLAQATTDLQVLYVTLKGKLRDDSGAQAAHDGVFELAQAGELRVPTESDCYAPVGVTASLTPAAQLASDVAEQTLASNNDESPTEPVEEEVLQELTAYFGDWLAACRQEGDQTQCDLQVAFNAKGEAGATIADDAAVTLSLLRRSGERTIATLRLPGREVDSPTKILWSVDALFIGDIVDSDIRVDESATRQILTSSSFVSGDLVPVMLKGNDISVELLKSYYDDNGEVFEASLVGLTRALAFADDFVAGSANP